MESIDKEMAKLDFEGLDQLEKPIRKGTLCAAKYKVDDSWYRARVFQSIGKGDVEVIFMDYGNIEVVK